jgi:hypothetical protein
VLAGEQHLSEVLVLFGEFFDGANISGHFLCLLTVDLGSRRFSVLRRNLVLSIPAPIPSMLS